MSCFFGIWYWIEWFRKEFRWFWNLNLDVESIQSAYGPSLLEKAAGRYFKIYCKFSFIFYACICNNFSVTWYIKFIHWMMNMPAFFYIISKTFANSKLQNDAWILPERGTDAIFAVCTIEISSKVFMLNMSGLRKDIR